MPNLMVATFGEYVVFARPRTRYITSGVDRIRLYTSTYRHYLEILTVGNRYPPRQLDETKSVTKYDIFSLVYGI